jgi:hypothetical protein
VLILHDLLDLTDAQSETFNRLFPTIALRVINSYSSSSSPPPPFDAELSMIVSMPEDEVGVENGIGAAEEEASKNESYVKIRLSHSSSKRHANYLDEKFPPHYLSSSPTASDRTIGWLGNYVEGYSAPKIEHIYARVQI